MVCADCISSERLGCCVLGEYALVVGVWNTIVQYYTYTITHYGFFNELSQQSISKREWCEWISTFAGEGVIPWGSLWSAIASRMKCEGGGDDLAGSAVILAQALHKLHFSVRCNNFTAERTMVDNSKADKRLRFHQPDDCPTSFFVQ